MGASVPAVGADGTIYVKGEDRLYALSPEGARKWSYRVFNPNGSPIIGNDGTVYVGGGYGFYAINPDGTLKWVKQLGDNCGDSAAVAADGTVYVSGGFLYSIAPGGEMLWHQGDFLTSSPVIGNSGSIYVRGYYDHRLFAYTSAGQELWKCLPDTNRYSFPTCPAVGSDGALYYTSSNAVWAVTSQGEILWSVAGKGSGGEDAIFPLGKNHT